MSKTITVNPIIANPKAETLKIKAEFMIANQKVEETP